MTTSIVDATQPFERVSHVASITALLTGEQHFIDEVLMPMSEVNGVEYSVVYLSVDSSSELDAFSQTLLAKLLTNPSIEIALASTGRRNAEQLLKRVMQRLCDGNTELRMKVIKWNTDCVWFQFPDTHDIRKLISFSRSQSRLPGISPNMLYIVIPS
jgi:hypothetical protein